MSGSATPKQAGHGKVRPTRVLIVEDEALFREMLLQFLDRQAKIEVVGAAGNGHDALRLVERTSPDVVLMDIELGSEPDGIRTAHLIKAAQPSVGIVILSMHRDKEFMAYIPERKATGWSFLLKQSIRDGAALVRAIEGASWGLVTVDPAVMERLRPRRRSILERLTLTQLGILREMTAGYTDSAIGKKLGMSEDTVSRMVMTIYDDLHITPYHALDQRVKAVLTFLKETTEQDPAWPQGAG
jgi:DNA-binding NarL/FixJ family response regulator